MRHVLTFSSLIFSFFTFNVSIWLRFSYFCTPNLCRHVQCSRTSISYSHGTMAHTLGFYTMGTGSDSQRIVGPNNHNRCYHRNDIVLFRHRYWRREMPAHDCSICESTYGVHESISPGQSRTKISSLRPISGYAFRPLDPMLLYPSH